MRGGCLQVSQKSAPSTQEAKWDKTGAGSEVCAMDMCLTSTHELARSGGVSLFDTVSFRAARVAKANETFPFQAGRFGTNGQNREQACV